MCAPVALGVASFGAQALGAVGQHQSASAQAAAQNAAATSNYKYQLQVRQNNWDRERFKYNRSIQQFEGAVNQNQLAAARAYAGEQSRLNEVYKKASFETQARLGKLIASSGAVAASGRSGKTADRLQGQANRMFGMNQAIQQESLTSAQNSFASRTDAVRNQLLSDNNKAYQNVAVQPMPGVAPPPPVMTQGPSGLGLVSGLLGAGVSGYNTYYQMENYEPNDGLG